VRAFAELLVRWRWERSAESCHLQAKTLERMLEAAVLGGAADDQDFISSEEARLRIDAKSPRTLRDLAPLCFKSSAIARLRLVLRPRVRSSHARESRPRAKSEAGRGVGRARAPGALVVR
jgi:hypothetical protein